MFARTIEWFKRRRVARQIKRARHDFHEVSDLAAYYEDQVNRLNVEIDVRYTEIQGLAIVRNTLMQRRNEYNETVAQLEASFRTA